jgi:hypothetical protein
MPVLPFFLRQRLEQTLRYYVLNAVEVCLPSITVEQDTLGKILVHLFAEMVRFHLMTRIMFHRVEADQIDIQWIQRGILLQNLRTELEEFRLGCRLPARRNNARLPPTNATCNKSDRKTETR